MANTFEQQTRSQVPYLRRVDNCVSFKDKLYWARQAENSPPPNNRRPVPDEDLEIIEGIYHKTFPDVGRKRGALLRYIKEMRENHHIPRRTEALYKNLIKASRT